MNVSTQIKSKLVIIRKSKLPVSLRTHRDEASYLKAKRGGVDKSPLRKEHAIKAWQHWKLIHNEFPYSAAFKVHHMLVPYREVRQKDLNVSERRELDQIIKQLEDSYDCMLINFEKKQSIKRHFHIHLLAYKDDRRHLKL